MASLIMTIDSDSDGEQDKKVSKKTKKGPKIDKEVFDADIMIDTAENPQIFKEQDAESDDSDYLMQDGGGHGNAWGFSKYMDAAPIQQHKATDASSNDGEEQEVAPQTMKERVEALLKENNIDMSNELKENVRDEAFKHVKPQNQAKLFYDKDDLIQFHELMLAKPLVKACSDLEYEHPTIIQRKVIPSILEGHDILAHSVTGSGKSASFLLPIL